MEDMFLLILIVMVLALLAKQALRDIPFLLRPVLRGQGIVTGHRSRRDEGEVYFAGVIRFVDDEGGEREFVDHFNALQVRPETGAIVEIVFPKGRADLARVPRPAIRAALYIVSIGVLIFLIAKWVV